MKTKYPILRRLVLTQLGIVTSGFLFLLFVYQLTYRAQIESSISALKEQITPILSERQEHWRAWKYLSLDSAIKEEQDDLLRKYPIERIQIIRKDELPRDISNLAIVLPKGVTKADDFIIYAQLSSNNLNDAIDGQRTVLIVLGLVAIFLLTSVIFSGRYIYQSIYLPIMKLNQILSKRGHGSKVDLQSVAAIGEMKEFITVINQMLTQAQSYEKQAAKFEVATQVAHDLRSPLEVLKGLKEEMTSFPDSSKRRIQSSIRRIEEITFNLLKTHKQVSGIISESRSEELLSLISSVLTEKSIEYRHFPEVDIVESFDTESYGLFSKINTSTFKSILSNLINNGVESLTDKIGVIDISLKSISEVNVIKITDNGLGIPSEVMHRIFTKGFTTKKNGNGIGLYNAKQEIEAMGGNLEFESEMGKGTSFIITLPKSESPLTFSDSINTHQYEKIIILDDDPAFHEVWNKRLAAHASKVEHIYSVKEMLTKYHSLNSQTLLLSDFELMDKHYDGIDTILILHHAKDSILVTARNEEQKIQDRCFAAGIKLLPKNLVNYVKILDHSSNSSPIILIDDDRLVHLNWKSHCLKNGFEFTGFMSINDFISASSDFDKASRIYIDSNLGDGIKGEIESEKIFALGFLNLYLATGYEKDSIQKPAWIKKIYSKSPENIGL